VICGRRLNEYVVTKRLLLRIVTCTRAYRITLRKCRLFWYRQRTSCMSISKDCIFSVSEIEDAVSRLKQHKNDGSSELATDHFIIYGGRDCLDLSWLSY